MRNEVFVIISALFVSCLSQDNTRFNVEQNCFSKNDTIVSEWKLVNVLDSAMIAQKISYKENNIVMDFRFDCDVAESLVPKYFYSTDSFIILSRGTGFHFREVILINKDLNVKRFETNIIDQNSKDMSLFLLKGKLFELDFLNRGINKVDCLVNYDESIEKFEVYGDSIMIQSN